MLRKKLKLDKEEDKTQIDSPTDDLKFNKSSNFESKYFALNISNNFNIDFAAAYLKIENDLVNDLKNWIQKLSNKKIAYCYQPLEYAYEPHYYFINKYCKSTKKILFLGINPGPFGMCQTGIPFGEIDTIKNWFKIDGNVNKPEIECPSRPIDGLSHRKTEISGKRFWGLFKRISEIPEIFFRYSFVCNYCPLAFMTSTGVNVGLQEIKGQQQKELEKICDVALIKILDLLQTEIVVAIGRYAETKAKELQKGRKLTVLYLQHPSPRVPKNENWDEKAEKFLTEVDLLRYFLK